MNTVRILFEGRNLSLLFQRLNGRGISVYRVKNLSDRQTVLSVKKSDLQWVQALTGTMWRMTVVGFGGLSLLKGAFIKSLPMVILTVVFTALCYLSDGYVLTVSVNGLSPSKRGEVLQLVEDFGIKAFSRFEDIDLKGIERYIYKNSDGLAFVSAKKWGNRLIIDTIPTAFPEISTKNGPMVTSKKTGKLIRLVVFSGTPLKAVGDTVRAGEGLMGGWFLSPTDQKIPIEPSGEYTLLCEEVLSFTVDGLTIESSPEIVTVLGLFASGLEEKDVLSISVLSITRVDAGAVVKIKITYVYQEVL